MTTRSAPLPSRFGRRLLQPVPEQERDVRPAELARELASFREELERHSRGPFRRRARRPTSSRTTRRASLRAARAFPTPRARPAARPGATSRARPPLQGSAKLSPARSGETSRTARTRVGEPVCPKRLSFGCTSGTRSAAVQTTIWPSASADRIRVEVSAVRRRGDRAEGRKRDLVRLLAFVSEASGPQRSVAPLERDDAGHLWEVQERGDLGRHLPGLGVERLAPAEDEVSALLLDCQRQSTSRAEDVGEREDAVGEMDAAVGADGKRLPEGLFCGRRAHRHRDHLAAVLVPQAGCMRDRVGVEAVQLERDAIPNERLRLVVEANRVAARHLLDEADDLHLGETTGRARGALRHPREPARP